MKKHTLLLLVLLTSFSFGCKKDTPADPLKVGDLYQGGYVFYLDASGQHGMIMAPAETERTLPWGCLGTNVEIGNNPLLSLGWGEYCTYRMVYKCNEVNAAGHYCYDQESGGYKDWFLPNLSEWLLAYKELGSNSTVNLKPNIHYWVSTEGDANRGTYCISSNISGGIFETKSAMNLVRAIRNF